MTRELGNGDTMIACEVKSGFTEDVPAVFTALPRKPKIEDIVPGSVGNMSTYCANPRLQERVERHLKAHALVIRGECGKDLITPADLDELQRREVIENRHRRRHEEVESLARVDHQPEFNDLLNLRDAFPQEP